MANAPDTSAYLLFVGDQADLPNSSVLTAGSGLSLTPSGVSPNSLQVINYLVDSNVAAINTMAVQGILAWQADGVFNNVTLFDDGTISITNPNGVGGDPVFSVNPNTTIQRVNARANGGMAYNGSVLNFLPGAGIGINVSATAPDTVNIGISSLSTGTVTEIGMQSSTGILIDPASITTSGTFDVNLPASGVGNTVVEGDLLVGGNSGTYTALGVASAALNDSLMNTATGVAWANWSIAAAAQNVDISAHDVENVATLFAQTVTLFNGVGDLSISTTVGASPYATIDGGALSSARNIVTAAPLTGGIYYGATNSFLIGNGTDYNVFGQTTPSTGDVIKCTGTGTFDWGTINDGSNWSTFDATQIVDMATFGFTDTGTIVFGNPTPISFGPTQFFTPVGYYATLTGGALAANNDIIVTAVSNGTPPYAESGSFLIGNGVDYTPFGTTTPTNGDIIQCTGPGAFDWVPAPTGTIAATGFGQLTVTSVISPYLWQSDPISVPGLTSSGLIVVGGCAGVSGDQAIGPVSALITGPGTFVIGSTLLTDQDTYVSYAVLSLT